MADGMICRRGGGAQAGDLTGFLDGTITELHDPHVTSLRNAYVFSGCTDLSVIDLPALSAFPSGISFSAVTPNLTTATFGVSAMVNTTSFSRATSLEEINLPNCPRILSNAFYGCTSLERVSLPSALVIGASAFYGATALSTISLPACAYLSTYAFGACSSLQSVYLMGSSMVALQNTEVFKSTPISVSTYLGTYGSVYVPVSLYDTYVADPFWTLYSSRIVGV